MSTAGLKSLSRHPDTLLAQAPGAKPLKYLLSVALQQFSFKSNLSFGGLRPLLPNLAFYCGAEPLLELVLLADPVRSRTHGEAEWAHPETQ